ncbi:MAG: acyl-CoA thioesterase [Lachnospiraceae bacterium]|nr:acyl-CoA thioesterase [Lachnospiraceae bacterium]MBP5223293.1 acyl-CoA thioesterase [Lachnospiraceae bacterium]
MANEIQLKGGQKEKKAKIRPYEHHTKYHETDQQGIIHHSNYVKWMEEARMNLLDQVGLGYKQMEEMELISPVLSLSVEYRSAVKFDETVLIDTKLVSYDGHQMEIAYRIYDKETGEDRAVAKSKHCFLNKSGIPISLKRTYPQLDTTFFEFQ